MRLRASGFGELRCQSVLFLDVILSGGVSRREGSYDGVSCGAVNELEHIQPGPCRRKVRLTHYNQPLVRAIRAASTRLPAPSLLIASDR